MIINKPNLNNYRNSYFYEEVKTPISELTFQERERREEKRFVEGYYG